MCWFCDDIKKFINKCVVVYDNTTANASKEYYHFYSDDTVTLKITAGGYRGSSHILTGMRELKGLKYCPNCGEKIEDFDNCASKENDKISCKIEKLKRDVEDLKKELDEVLIGDRDQLTESYIENKRKTYKRLKADRRGIKYQLDNCSFNLYDVDINLASLRRIDKKISEIESSKIFKYIKEELIMAKKYREKPCNEVEAVQWTGKNISEVRNFTIKNRNGVEEQRSYLSSSSYSDNMPKLFIMEPDKDVEVSRNDYIVKGTDGEFYVCERNVFEAVYEEVEEPKSVQSTIYEHVVSKAIAEREFTKRYRDIANLYERLAKGGIECSMTVDDENGIWRIYTSGDIGSD